MSNTDDTEAGGIKSLDERVLEVFAIEAEGAKKAGTLGYMARALASSERVHLFNIANIAGISRVSRGCLLRKGKWLAAPISRRSLFPIGPRY